MLQYMKFILLTLSCLLVVVVVVVVIVTELMKTDLTLWKP